MLKRLRITIGFIMILMVIMLAFGCSDSKSDTPKTSGGDGNNGAVHLGEILKSHGQVYLTDFGLNSVNYSKLTGINDSLYCIMNDVVVGSINDGLIECEVTPDMIDLISAEESMSVYIFDDTASNEHTQISKDVRFGWINFLYTPDANVFRGYISNVRLTATSLSFTLETVLYVYVEEDVLVSGQKFTKDDVTRNGFSFTLREGWNAVYRKIDSSNRGFTISFDLKNPDYVVWTWELIEDYRSKILEYDHIRRERINPFQ